MSRSIMRITPESYQESRRHRKVADTLIARAGLRREDVREAWMTGSGWTLTVLERDDQGKPFLRDGEIAQRYVDVPL